MGGSIARLQGHPSTDIQSARTAFEKAWCSAFKDATAQPHPSPLIDTGDVTHIAEELPNGMDSPRESALETREERCCRFSLAVGALRAAAQDTWSPVYFRAVDAWCGNVGKPAYPEGENLTLVDMADILESVRFGRSSRMHVAMSLSHSSAPH